MGGDSYCSQTIKEGSESILLVATLRSLFVYHRPSTETMPPAEGREVQQSFEQSLPTYIKYREKM